MKHACQMANGIVTTSILENVSAEERSVTFSNIAINGIADEQFALVSEKIKPGCSATRYDEVFGVRGGVIKSITYGDFKILGENYEDIYRGDKSTDEVTITTDFDYEFDMPKVPGVSRLIYYKNPEAADSQDPEARTETDRNQGGRTEADQELAEVPEKGISIYATRHQHPWSDRTCREVWIYNRTDDEYYVKSTRPTLQGDTLDRDFGYIISDTRIPAHTLYILRYVYPSMEEDEEKEYDQKTIESSFTFTNQTSPEKSFRTPALRIN